MLYAFENEYSSEAKDCLFYTDYLNHYYQTTGKVSRLVWKIVNYEHKKRKKIK